MTILKIIPDFENKTAECVGYPSAGEHVDVRIVGAANLLPSPTLRFRVKFGHVTLALFPRPDVNETWKTEGADLKCHLDLNTIQARRICRTGNTVCHAILDQLGDDEHTVEPTLFFDDLFETIPWHRELGTDEPYDLDKYPDQIADLNRRVTVLESRFPSPADNVLEFPLLSEFPANGKVNTIYIAKDTNRMYRWSGSQYVPLGGGGVGEDVNAVHYYAETKTDAQKAQARVNIGAAAAVGPTQPYARNDATGLWHRLSCRTEDGETFLLCSQTGEALPNQPQPYLTDETTGLRHRVYCRTDAETGEVYAVVDQSGTEPNAAK